MMQAGRPKGTTGQAQVLSDTEINKIVLDLFRSGKKNARRNLALVVMSFKLGLRAKELAGLKIKDVYDGHKVKKTLRLLSEYTKGSKHRDLPLENETVISVLEQYMLVRRSQDGRTFNIEAPLFRSQKGTAFSPNSLSRLFIELYKSYGFEKASSHTGRRSLLTKLANQGHSAFYIRDIAGHSSVVTTQAYIDKNPSVYIDILKRV